MRVHIGCDGVGNGQCWCSKYWRTGKNQLLAKSELETR